MNNKWRGNGYDRFGYVQRGYDNDRMYEEIELSRSYRDWQRANDRANRSNVSTNPCAEIYMEPDKPKPDRRILLALG